VVFVVYNKKFSASSLLYISECTECYVYCVIGKNDKNFWLFDSDLTKCYPSPSNFVFVLFFLLTLFIQYKWCAWNVHN